ncbi:MAG: DNA methyltransferase [Candidatus Dormibacteraeota bacterium]|nr:DNA methyltransferase [Candidatus Dormibacteraeota bacterium]MBO0744828.1 DNA methyltransferase [Candidatus Dormibacteraeota bacterium]
MGRARLLALAALVGPGEWTTYGDLAAAADLPSPRIPAHVAATDPRFPNAVRVLGAGGRIRRPTTTDIGRVRVRLEAEGIRFRGDRADPARHVTWLDLRARADASNPSPLPSEAPGDRATEMGLP